MVRSTAARAPHAATIDATPHARTAKLLREFADGRTVRAGGAVTYTSPNNRSRWRGRERPAVRRPPAPA